MASSADIFGNQSDYTYDAHNTALIGANDPLGGNGIVKRTLKQAARVSDMLLIGCTGGIRSVPANKKAESRFIGRSIEKFESGNGEVKSFFDSKSIEIEDFKLCVPEEVYKLIHKGKASGVLSEIWRDFIKKTQVQLRPTS